MHVNLIKKNCALFLLYKTRDTWTNCNHERWRKYSYQHNKVFYEMHIYNLACRSCFPDFPTKHFRNETKNNTFLKTKRQTVLSIFFLIIIFGLRLDSNVFYNIHTNANVYIRTYIVSYFETLFCIRKYYMQFLECENLLVSSRIFLLFIFLYIFACRCRHEE